MKKIVYVVLILVAIAFWFKPIQFVINSLFNKQGLNSTSLMWATCGVFGLILRIGLPFILIIMIISYLSRHKDK